MKPIDRRSLLQSGAIGLVASSLPGGTAFAKATEPESSLLAALRNPPVSSRPQLRWWWPGGTIDPAEVRREVAQIAAAGFGGFEIADVRDSVTLPIDPKVQGWGSPAWIAGVDAALEEAIRLGIAPSLTLGPHWPTGVPGVQPDDDAASKELVHGATELRPGQRFSGPLPPPLQELPSGALERSNPNPPSTPVLLAVQAMQVDESAGPGLPQLDPDSLIDLTGKAKGGRLDWHAPKQGQWRVLTFWMRGTGQIQNMFGMNKTGSMLADPVPYVLDIYGPAAVAALTRYWDEHLLSSRTRSLLKQAGGTFFEDSLELSFACPWTPSAIAEFVSRRGYDLAPYLAILVSRQPSFDEMILGRGRPQLFRLKGVDATRVRHDYDSLLSELYVENRLKGLAKWSARLGMTFRVQAIGSEINAGLAAAVAPVPEGDNSHDVHGWRKLAAGRDIGGVKLLSDEAATFVQGISHVATWRDALYMVQRDMAGGANQIMLHGFSYADAPGASWPGFSAFGRAIGNDWGPRDPNWTMAAGATAYLGRLQHLLRQGTSKTDLAVLGEPLKSQTVLQAGYTFQYPEMDLLTLPQMQLRGGQLMPNGPGYRALVLNRLVTIDLAAAQQINSHAAAGFPVVIVGDPPFAGRGWLNSVESDHQIKVLMKALVAHANVRVVEHQAEVPSALAALGVASRIGFSVPCRVLAVQRSLDDGELFYLLNDSAESVAQDLTLRADGIPCQLDLWTGEAHEVPGWRKVDGAVALPLSLASDEPRLVLVTRSPIAGMQKSVAARGSRFDLTGWNVELDSWLPGHAPSETRHQIERLRLDRLAAWRELPGHQGMAGTARYSAILRLPKGADLAATTIDLGKIGGTASLSVNGSPARMVNPFTLRARIGQWLKPGDNLIEVMVASPLNNRLLAEGIAVQGFKPPVDADPSNAPPPPPPPKVPDDPDLFDGPSGLAGMQPGAAPPGGLRVYRDYGLLGPVIVTF